MEALASPPSLPRRYEAAGRQRQEGKIQRVHGPTGDGRCVSAGNSHSYGPSFPQQTRRTQCERSTSIVDCDERGTSDVRKGFRQNHPVVADQPLCIVTFNHPRTRKRVYVRLKGLPFGLGSVVNQFNRLPHLFTAIQIIILFLLAIHYFDDNALLDVATWAAVSKQHGKALGKVVWVRVLTQEELPYGISLCFPGTHDGLHSSTFRRSHRVWRQR